MRNFISRNFFILIPGFILLVMPWMHRIFYENLMLAWPQAPSDLAHGTIIIIGFVLTVITCRLKFG